MNREKSVVVNLLLQEYLFVLTQNASVDWGERYPANTWVVSGAPQAKSKQLYLFGHVSDSDLD